MKTRYSTVKYKVFDTSEPLASKFPELFRHKQFQKLRAQPNCDDIVRYIVALYDKNSELIHEFQNDLKARKEEAAKDAGFKKSNGKWPVAVQDIMEIRNQDTNQAILQYLKIQRHNVWMEITITEQELYDYQELRFTPVKKGKKTLVDEKLIVESTVKKGALMDACDKRRQKLDALYEEFFGDNVELMELEFEEAITPEKAERMLSQAPYEEVK
jgi:hypothetical protein